MKIKMTKEEKKVISISHSKLLRNLYILEMNKASKSGIQELADYYQQVIDGINYYLDACGIQD
jgi:hypothetical protein